MTSADPSGQSFWHNKFFGIPDFSMALSVPVGPGLPYQLKASVYLAPLFGMHKLWGDQSHDLDVEHALRFLIVHWLDIAGPFSRGGSQKAEIDLSHLFSQRLPPVRMKRDGIYVGFDFMHLKSDLNSHSVIVIECLLQLGDLLASIVDSAALRSEWRDRRLNTDLLPFGVEVEFGKYEQDGAVSYYARHLGHSPEEYVRWAVWDYARRLVWADSDVASRGPEPIETFFTEPAVLPFNLPSQFELDRLVEQASEMSGICLQKLVEDAIENRNCDARQIVVYRRWYGQAQRETDTGFSGVIECTMRGSFLADGFVASEEKDALLKSLGSTVNAHENFARFVPAGQKDSVPAVVQTLSDPEGLVFTNRPVTLTGWGYFESGRPYLVRAKAVVVDEIAETFRMMKSHFNGTDEG